MIKQILVVVAVLVATVSFGQREELTLEDAVMQQYRDFYPQSLAMFQWVPDTDCYTYLEE